MEDLSYKRREREAAMRRKKNRRRKTTLIIICVVLALILALLVTGVVYFESLLGLINRVDDVPQETMSQEEYDAFMNSMQETVDENYTGDVHEGDVEWGGESGLIESGDDVLNVLLIGQDRRSVDQGRSRSDVIILCTVNKPAKTLTITSFMRDMYVQIPGYEDNRINVPYVLGGMDLLDETLATNFGVQVDGNIEVDFYGFIGIVDLMGGIEVELSQDEATYMNQNYSWDVDYGGSKYWNLKAGVNQLTGAQALSYARMRYVGHGDYERTERQRRVLSALVEKAKELSITELNLLLQHALPMITTDFDNQEILNYALELFPLLPELTVNTLRIPADDAYQSTYVRSMAVLLPNLAKNRDILEEAMKIPGAE